MQQLNILIINLPRYKSIPLVREERCEGMSEFRIDTPATLLIMASLLRDKGHKIDFIDANAFNLSYENVSQQMTDKKFDCVIFSFNSQILDYDLEICNIVKKINPSCITIGYSWFSRYYAREVLAEYANLDVYIIGAPTSIIGNLVECISKNGNPGGVGGIAYRDKNNIIINEVYSEVDFNDLPMPAYDLLPSFKPYYVINSFLRPYALVYCGRGCPFGCTYCNVAKTKHSGRSADNIIKELKMLKRIGNVKYVWFYDELFTIDRKRVIEVSERIREENINIKWFCDSRVELVDAELLKIMHRGGCIGISYGVESGSQKILNSMNKGNTVKQAQNALIWTRKAHIPIQLNLILGFIGEDEETLNETRSLVRTTLPEKIQIAVINAKPGTEFTKLAIENKWVDENANWKQHLTTGLGFTNYEPFNLNLDRQRVKIKRMLYYNPKWWVTGISSLIRNRRLFWAAIGYIVGCFRK